MQVAFSQRHSIGLDARTDGERGQAINGGVDAIFVSWARSRAATQAGTGASHAQHLAKRLPTWTAIGKPVLSMRDALRGKCTVQQMC